MQVLTEARDTGSPAAAVTSGCERPSRCRDSNPGSLQEQDKLLRCSLSSPIKRLFQINKRQSDKEKKMIGKDRITKDQPSLRSCQRREQISPIRFIKMIDINTALWAETLLARS